MPHYGPVPADPRRHPVGAGERRARFELDAPLIVDLADIIYEADTDIAASFADDPSLGALVPYFEANDACYSYLTFKSDGFVAFAAEKKVISSHASAGTCHLPVRGLFIAAAGRSLAEFRDELTVGDALFVCPALNSGAARHARGAIRGAVSAR